MNIHTIVTHKRPHFDELVAIWLLKRFGAEQFPGADKARIAFWNAGESPDGKTPEEYEKKGVLLIGVGGGRFDEHPTLKEGRKRDECAATLVAKAIGVDGLPELEKILKFVADHDLRGNGHPFDIAYMVKLIHGQFPKNPMWAWKWVSMALDSKYHEQWIFWNEAKAEFGKSATEEITVGADRRKLKLVAVQSDNEHVSKYARFVLGKELAVVVQQQSSGNVQIFANKGSGTTILNAVRLIRLEEQVRKGKLLTANWEVLGADGKVEGAEEWYFHKEAQQLLNGSLTAGSVAPTKIPLPRITELVRIGLDPAALAREKSKMRNIKF